jgi:hypothetical protein
MRKYYYEFEGIDILRNYYPDFESAKHEATETSKAMLRKKMVEGNEITAKIYCEENGNVFEVAKITTTMV